MVLIPFINTAGKWSCVEIFGLWKWLLATLDEVAVRLRRGTTAEKSEDGVGRVLP